MLPSAGLLLEGQGRVKGVPGTQEVHTSTCSGMEKHLHRELGLEREALMSPSLNEVGRCSSGSVEQGTP